MPSSPKPAFGQVWQYSTASPVMLTCPLDRLGKWRAFAISTDDPMLELEWFGLYDDPESRLAGWKLLSVEDE